MHSWNDPQNAELYDLFTRKHRLYRDTSDDLVDLARIQNAALVVDLACGTGVSTEVILERLDSTARVIAIDGSEAMLQIARRRVPDPRVRWVIADGAEIAAHAREADAILCNSAIWQTDMDRTISACARALRSGGRLVFNIGRGYIGGQRYSEEPAAAKPTFLQLMQAVAACDHGFVAPATAPRATRSRKRLTYEIVEEMIRNAGLVLDSREDKVYDEPAEAQLDWFSVPVFADAVLPGMPYDQQRKVIATAYERFDKSSARQRRMVATVAHKP
jgi:SAM-dependent methyltransferase